MLLPTSTRRSHTTPLPAGQVTAYTPRAAGTTAASPCTPTPTPAHTPHWIAAAPPATSPRLTLAEAILEAAGQVLHVPHAPAAGGLAADGLLTPLDCRAQQASRQAAAAQPDVSAVGPSARQEMCNLLLQQCQRQPQPQVWRLLLVLLLLLQG